MNNDEIDEKEFEDKYNKQSELAIFISALMLFIFIILSFILCKLTSDELESDESTTSYEMVATIEEIARHEEEFSVTVSGVHDNQIETYTIAIDRSQFMKYKQGEELSIRIKNGHCHIIE